MAKNISEKIDRMFPPEEFENLASSTQGSDLSALSEEFSNRVKDFFNKNPKLGIIYFERLEDGRYLVRHYVSRE
jgi:hypothetical protein